MVPRSHLPRVLVGVLLVGALVSVAAGPTAASPRPISVCAPCDRGFVSAAHGHDVDVRIERSTATMRVHRNGSATWTVENRLDAAAASAFRQNETLRRAVAREAVGVHDGTLLSTRMADDTLRMRYRTPDAAARAPGGVLRVEQFRDSSLRTYTDLGADRLTLVAPPGMVVDRGLPGANVSSRRMTVTDFDSEGDGPFVTLVPEGALAGPLWSLLAIALPIGSVVARNALLLVAVPSLLFAGGLRAVAWAVSTTDLDGEALTNRPALVVVALALVLAAHPLYGDLAFVGTSPSLFAVAVGAAALGGALARPAVRERLSVGRLAAIVGLAFAVAAGTALALQALPLGDLSPRADATPARLVLPALPVYTAALVGYAADTDRLRWSLVLAAGAFALVPLTTFSVASQGGSLYFLGVALVTFGALAGVVASVPLFLLGYGLPDAAQRDGRAH
ncbi:hypothetical protein [Haloplanus halobius]|uniref:hypothetical protein n=1 Tax=Haloplanus halobius TaxID=2934938 RepID=UPI00200EA6CA|nr:hypothetical protein [Haloplanus sp. XH21]